MKESRDYLELAYRSIHCFTNDGKLLVPELDQMLAIALKDGRVDSNEERVLEAIFRRLQADELTPSMQQRIAQVRALYAG